MILNPEGKRYVVPEDLINLEDRLILVCRIQLNVEVVADIGGKTFDFLLGYGLQFRLLEQWTGHDYLTGLFGVVEVIDLELVFALSDGSYAAVDDS